MGQSFSAEPVVEKHTETDRNETYDAAVSTCQGWRFSQEDDHSLRLVLPGEHKASFFAVFDGHGSAKVSKHAAESLWRHLIENELYIKGNFKEALEQSFLSFDREVFDSYNAQLAGTTATSVLIVDNVIYCANIGDSRSVASVNCQCVPLSHDHKPENPLELKRILAAGGYVLGNRVNGNLALSRAFGDFHYKSNEQLPADQQIVSPFPEIQRIELNDDVDFIVLACDGIWDVLTSEEVVEFVISRLEHEVRPDQICEQLTTRCLATDYELVIGCDNMTVLLVCYVNGRSWSDYCTDIFNKNSKRLGQPNRKRELDNTFGNETTTFQPPNQRYDDTTSTHHSDPLGTSSSSDQSSGAPLNSSIGRLDPSFADVQPSPANIAARGRAMDELFHLLRTLDTSPGSEEGRRGDADETPPISEVPVEREEVVTIHDDEEAPAKPSDSDAPTSDDAQQEQQQQERQQQSNTTENQDPDKSLAAAGDEGAKREETQAQEEKKADETDENLIASGTAEISLADAAAADEENLPTENEIEPIEMAADEENVPDESEIEPIDLGAMKAEEEEPAVAEGEELPQIAENTVEIELSAPDDGPGEAGEETSAGDEADEGITVEEPPEEGSNAGEEENQEPQEDTNNEASKDTSEDS